ncbi:MAG TPA: hypothetical protein VLR50_09505 [Desulfobacterales bacterium]|nr:hypothetical protein [Desulfobacterales bacterium]
MVTDAMGFIRNQEEKLTAKFLRWQYEKQKLPLPTEADLMTQTARIVDEAHRIARERGGNLLMIMKELVRGFLEKK